MVWQHATGQADEDVAIGVEVLVQHAAVERGIRIRKLRRFSSEIMRVKVATEEQLGAGGEQVGGGGAVGVGQLAEVVEHVEQPRGRSEHPAGDWVSQRVQIGTI